MLTVTINWRRPIMPGDFVLIPRTEYHKGFRYWVMTPGIVYQVLNHNNAAYVDTWNYETNSLQTVLTHLSEITLDN